MAATVSADHEPFWKMGREGMDLLLNNQQEEARTLFRKYSESIIMYSGYAAVNFMDALMSYEEDKLNLASQTLRETEKRCAGGGWFKIIRGKSNEEDMSYDEYLESQIIKADAEMYLATLTFLQQDITGYFRGAWILRKSWKHYQQTYNEIQTVYNQIVGENSPEVSASVPPNMEEDSSNFSMPVDPDDGNNPAEIPSDLNICLENDVLNKLASTMTTIPPKSTSSLRNGYIPKSQTTHFPKIPNSPQTPPETILAIKKSQSVNSALNKYTIIQKTLTKLSPFNSNSSLLTTLNPFYTNGPKLKIDKESITRLMKGISFGYGLLQLGMSLLPPSILRLTNFLGFQGNRKQGLANLKYARTGNDMRAPLATLALLWYHTIVRPFFSLDGNNVQAGVQVAATLINEAMETYSNSSLFLFFKGRVDRLKSDIPSAITAFKASVENSNHREIKILSQHEVGWCYMIQLDHESARITFLYLKHQSRWSRGFYAYLTIICCGANGNIKDMDYVESYNLFMTTPKGSQLEDFLARRFKICRFNNEEFLAKPCQFWKLLVYELLYLWNSLPSCNYDNLRSIINDCDLVVKDNLDEPFVGLSYLIAGSTYCIMKDFPNGIEAFRNCLEIRKNSSYHSDDAHVSAFALYELGQLLIKENETKAEGKACLEQVQQYKDYDFEHRLSVRIFSILKNL